MGGSGSTRWGSHSNKRTVERCSQFTLADITRTQSQSLLKLIGISGGIGWTNGSSIGYTIQHIDNRLQLVLKYSAKGRLKTQPIPISETQCNYGGVRHWMHCPDCCKRVGKLYCVDGEFACRQCHDLTYTSAQQAHYFDSLRGLFGAGLDKLDNAFEMLNLLKKWDARKHLTKGERRKLADALNLPLAMVRSRWYRHDVQYQKAYIRLVLKSLTKPKKT